MNPLHPIHVIATAVMDDDETHRFLRQLFLIRYTSLVERIREKMNLTDEVAESMMNAVVRVDWIDTTLHEVKSLPVP